MKYEAVLLRASRSVSEASSGSLSISAGFKTYPIKDKNRYADVTFPQCRLMSSVRNRWKYTRCGRKWNRKKALYDSAATSTKDKR